MYNFKKSKLLYLIIYDNFVLRKNIDTFFLVSIVDKRRSESDSRKWECAKQIERTAWRKG